MKIKKASKKEFDISYAIENEILSCQQIDITTHHTLHCGVYTRTAFLPKGTFASGSVIKIPTTVLISGNIKFLVGKKVHDIVGFKAIEAMANRKQVAYAIEDTYITMLFKTDASTVEEAEREFTDDFDLLMSRKKGAINMIGGKTKCLV